LLKRIDFSRVVDEFRMAEAVQPFLLLTVGDQDSRQTSN
jgi:hypothetical protein